MIIKSSILFRTVLRISLSPFNVFSDSGTVAAELLWVCGFEYEGVEIIIGRFKNLGRDPVKNE